MSDNNTKSVEGDGDKRPSIIVYILLVVLILGAGVGGAFILVKSKKPPKTVEKPLIVPLVEVMQINRRNIPITVKAFGTVQPKVQVEIVPQVAGNVVYVNPAFKPGGFVKANQPLIEIDPRDYELAVEQAKALVADAEVKLELEQAEADVALTQWKQLNPNEEPTSALVLRKPQIKQAEATLKSAQATLASAKLNLERTKVSLPVDAVIMDEKVDLGQFVGAGQSVGSAYGIDAVEIELPLEDEELAWFEIPESPVPSNTANNRSPKTPATVQAAFAGAEHTWQGHVTRITGQVDEVSRMVSVVVEVVEPFSKTNGKPPLMPGMFVEALISGKTLENAVAVPRDAVHNRNQVWTVQDSRLSIKTLDILRADGEFVYALSGIDDGAMIVTSALDTATDGMKVRTEKDEPTALDDTSKRPNNSKK